MAVKSVKDIMVPISEYAIVSENETIHDALQIIRQSHTTMDPDKYFHRAILIKNRDGDIVGKLGYFGFLSALDPKYENMSEMKALAGSGITKKDLCKDMRNLGFWNDKLPVIKQRAKEITMKQVMVKFDEHIDEDGSLSEALHTMVQLNVLSILTTKDDHITGIIRLSDLFEEITDYILADD
ncbi:MAG: CBS domain-containing protein [candidate division Zixibacteria bacterium]|nr:CBS domain-containing protein [candidate division Zixibacteria bacterium]